MRSRTIREGSVGLLILTGLAAFVGLVLWIRGMRWGARTYQFIVSFTDVAGMKVGASVRYRGVDVGKITDVKATTNGVDATIEIDSANLVIPRNVTIEANQSGLIGETSIDITPPTNLPSGIEGVTPSGSKCDAKLVICNQNRVNGEIGVSFIELLRNTDKFTTLYADPAFFDNVNNLTKNAALAAGGVAKLTAELSLLTRSVRQQVGTFSAATNTLTAVSAQTANRIGNTADKFGNTADKFGNTADKFGKLAESSNGLLTTTQGTLTTTQTNLNNTLQQFGQLAASANQTLTSNQGNLNNLLTEFTKLAASTNELVATNRGTLQTTLTNMSQSSEQLSILLTRLANTTEQLDVAKIVGNLETLSANAAEASANLRDVSAAVNNPTNFLVLQQTLDSARSTFENVQKITADLDELTGDPQFRQHVKELVNGLSKLVSSTQQLEEQIQVAQKLESVNSALNEAAAKSTTKTPLTQPSPPETDPKETNPQPHQDQFLLQHLPATSKRESDKYKESH